MFTGLITDVGEVIAQIAGRLHVEDSLLCSSPRRPGFRSAATAYA